MLLIKCVIETIAKCPPRSSTESNDSYRSRLLLSFDWLLFPQKRASKASLDSSLEEGDGGRRRLSCDFEPEPSLSSSSSRYLPWKSFWKMSASIDDELLESDEMRRWRGTPAEDAVEALDLIPVRAQSRQTNHIRSVFIALEAEITHLAAPSLCTRLNIQCPPYFTFHVRRSIGGSICNLSTAPRLIYFH